MKVTPSSVLLALCLSSAASAWSKCSAVQFDVSGTALNVNLTGNLPLTSLPDLIKFVASAPRILVSGNQTLAGTYCEPAVKNANNDKLQAMFGSITADRNGWSALGGVGTDFPEYQPERYSWVRYATELGYATLALDRLGNGKSSHPDPLLTVQAPYEIELYNDLSKQIRAGKTGALPRAYSHIIYVGNSYGSQLGTGMAGAHPDAYNEFILTGYSLNAQQDFVGVSLITPLPAAIVDPARFGTLPPGYVTSSSEVGRTNSFFGSKAQVAFDDTVGHLFFTRKDVVSLGQFVSVYALPYFGGAFTGRVLTLTGEQDQAFCGPGSPVIGPAHCGTQLRDTGALFPAAKYNYKSVDKTGHAIQVHYSAQTVFKVAHDFLAGQNFQGGPPA